MFDLQNKGGSWAGCCPGALPRGLNLTSSFSVPGTFKNIIAIIMDRDDSEQKKVVLSFFKK